MLNVRVLPYYMVGAGTWIVFPEWYREGSIQSQYAEEIEDVCQTMESSARSTAIACCYCSLVLSLPVKLRRLSVCEDKNGNKLIHARDYKY